MRVAGKVYMGESKIRAGCSETRNTAGLPTRAGSGIGLQVITGTSELLADGISRVAAFASRSRPRQQDGKDHSGYINTMIEPKPGG